MEGVINGSLPKILLLFILKMLYSLGYRKPHGWVVSKTDPLFPVSQRGWNDWYRCKQHRVPQNFSLIIWCIQIFISIQMMLYSQWFSTPNIAFSLRVLLYPTTQKLETPSSNCKYATNVCIILPGFSFPFQSLLPLVSHSVHMVAWILKSGNRGRSIFYAWAIRARAAAAEASHPPPRCDACLCGMWVTKKNVQNGNIILATGEVVSCCECDRFLVITSAFGHGMPILWVYRVGVVNKGIHHCLVNLNGLSIKEWSGNHR